MRYLFEYKITYLFHYLYIPKCIRYVMYLDMYRLTCGPYGLLCGLYIWVCMDIYLGIDTSGFDMYRLCYVCNRYITQFPLSDSDDWDSEPHPP